MTKETAERIARHNTTDAVQKWSSGVMRFAMAAHPALLTAEVNACKECPYRNNSAMGGCISEDCPIYAVRKALQLATKRAAMGAKEIYKAKYRLTA